MFSTTLLARRLAPAGACLLAYLTPLALEAANIEEVLIQGSSRDINDEIAMAAKVPGGVTVLDTETLGQQNMQSLADMLRFAPGVWATSTSGGQSTFFTSRGSNLDATDYDGNGIKLLADGLPVTTADGNNHNRAIDPLSARSATIARGANAMSYGASTLGGAINFVSPTAKTLEGTKIRLDGGSHDLESVRVTAAAQSGALDGLLTLESYSRGGYREHSLEDRDGLYANAGWQVSDELSTRFYGTLLNNHIQLPGALTRDQLNEDSAQAAANAVSGNFQLNVETRRIANRTTWLSAAGQRWEFGISIEEQSLHHPIVDKVMVDFDGAGPMQPVEVFSLLIGTDHRDIGGMLRSYQTLENHELAFGLNYGENHVDGGHYRNDAGNRNGLSTRIDNHAENLEWFVQDQWSLSEQLVITSAVQGVSARRETWSESVSSGAITNPKGDYAAINPRLGMLYSLSEEVSLYANVSRLYEPPTNFELQDDERGTGEPLEAMSGTSLEVGTRGSNPVGANSLWWWDLALYYARIQDEILSREDPSAPGTSLSANIDETVHAGLEALIAGRFGLRSGLILEPSVNLTLNHFRFGNDPVYGNNRLPAAPDYMVRGELMFRHTSGYFAGPSFDLIGDRWADFSNTYLIDSYQLLGFRAGYEAMGWQVFVDLQNLLDKGYVADHSVRDLAATDDAILHAGAPRSVYLGMELSF